MAYFPDNNSYVSKNKWHVLLRNALYIIYCCVVNHLENNCFVIVMYFIYEKYFRNEKQQPQFIYFNTTANKRHVNVVYLVISNA